MKTAEELKTLKAELKEMDRKLAELSTEELETVFGGAEPFVPTAGKDVVTRAMQERGKPYQWGAVGPAAYDCSGLVSYCLTGVHTRIGTTGTFMGWPRVLDPQPGDVCTSSDHCGIYIGGGCMIHAPTFGAVVSIAPVQSGMIFVRQP